MFDEIFGLPAHPLMVHAPVVLIPLTVVAAVVYALLPPLRPRVGWVLVLASLGGTATAWAAAQAGVKMSESLQSSPQLNEHGQHGELLWQYAGLLAVVSVVLVAVDVSRRSRASAARDDDEYGYSHRRASGRSSGGVLLGVVSLVLTLALLGAAGVAGYYAVRTGHTGATMVWGNS